MTDLEIAHNVQIRDIDIVAGKLGIQSSIEKYGNYLAKIVPEELGVTNKGKLVLVTATSPTPFGEGKTTTTIGLLDAFYNLGKKAVASLREPSLGPVFGLKGGATGGGYSQIIPMEDINMHFTGDFHAITAANNLLCAAIDNHLFHGNKLNIDKNKIMINRCLDINDRALRSVLIKNKVYEREEHFIITAASEIMAIICLAEDLNDLRNRLEKIVIAYNKNNEPVYAKDLNVVGAMLVLLKDAIKPNLVQTLDGNPVIVHGGPFANIAHGCSSYIATNLGLKLADYCITEAGFGTDLGALKFYDILCRNKRMNPDVIVLVTTINALKYNGHNDLHSGIRNLEAHLDILKRFNQNIIVCLNKYDKDIEKDIEYVSSYVTSRNFKFVISEAYKNGGTGTIELAKEVITLIDNESKYQELYDLNISIKDKIDKIVKDIYHAKDINYTEKANNVIDYLENNNLDKLPICIAKTPLSISDKKELLGSPSNYDVIVNDIKLYNGAGFITVYLGNIITMPGLPLKPNYENINLNNNEVIGVF